MYKTKQNKKHHIQYVVVVVVSKEQNDYIKDIYTILSCILPSY